MFYFGDRLKELRIKKKLTQQQVANKIGITRASVSSFECNSKIPRIDRIVEFARIYDTSVDYILGLEKRESI